MFTLRHAVVASRSSAVQSYKLIIGRSYVYRIQSLDETKRKTKVSKKSSTSTSRTNVGDANKVDYKFQTTKSDYDYFESLANNAQAGKLTNVEGDLHATSTDPSIITTNKNIRSKEIMSNNTVVHNLAEPTALQHFKIKPSIPKKSFNLAAYVNESETLSNLIKLGVDLSKIDEDAECADYILKLDFETGVQPYLSFLHKTGVSDADVGVCITRNPAIFRESLNDLDVRVNYLEMKKFSLDAIARIIVKAPTILSRTVKQIDAQLGFLQRLFLLTGDEIRLVVTSHPKIAVWNQDSIKNMKMTLKDLLGFTESQLKNILQHCPKILLSDRHAVTKRFDYLHNSIGYSHEDILVWPQVLRTRVFIIRQRHGFLRSISRDQFDPKKENYVSLKSLALGRDSDFCQTVAKVPVTQFNEFLKMH